MGQNIEGLGLSYCMGQKLRHEVESQLLSDLLVYRNDNEDLSFDWSESCIEGKCAHIMDGSVENFSGVKLLDSRKNLFADGWMDFVIDQNNVLIVYWKYLDIVENGNEKAVKDFGGMADHNMQRLEKGLRDGER